MLMPTVHINGTPKERLEKYNLDALYSIGESIKLLCAAAPNDRDFYMQPGYINGTCLNEHFHRLERLKSVYNEIEAIVFHIQQQ